MTRKILLYLLHSAYLALAASPLVLYAVDSAGGALWPALLLLAGASFAGNAVSRFLRSHRAPLALLVAALAAVGAALLPMRPWSFLLALLNAVVALTGARRRWQDAETEFLDARVMGAGLILCAVIYLMGLFNGLPAVQVQVGYLAYAELMVSLLLINRQSVRSNAGSQARRMMRGNQALTWIFMVVLTLAAFFGALREAVGRGLRAAISALLGLFSGGESTGTVESGGGMGQMDLSSLGESGALPEWLQVLGTVILTLFAVAALLAFAGFVVYALWKAFRTLAERLRAWLQRFQEEGAEEYSEESEQMLSAESMRREIGRQIRKTVRRALTPPPRWGAMTPSERVRYVYACLLRRQSKVAPGAVAMTPEQLCQSAELDPDFAELYDRVRYGQREPSAEEAERWRGAAKP